MKFQHLHTENENSVPQPSHFKRVIQTRRGSCWLFHRWVKLGAIGNVLYQECWDCKARKVEGTGYISRQSLDWVMNA